MSNLYEDIFRGLIAKLESDLSVTVSPGTNSEIIEIAETPSIVLRGPSFRPKEQDEDPIEVDVEGEIRRFEKYAKDDMMYDLLLFHNDKIKQLAEIEKIQKWFLANKQFQVNGIDYTIKIEGELSENSIPNYSNLQQWGLIFFVEDVVLWGDDYEVVVKVIDKEIETEVKE